MQDLSRALDTPTGVQYNSNMKSPTRGKPKASPPAAEPDGRLDGRRERSKSSRAKIVAAMLELVARGEVDPSAAQVASTAGVGLRSVFRHFDDMDALYREMTEVIEAEIMPMIAEPYRASSWRDRIRELAERRARVFETIMPYRISANLKRFQSNFLMRDYRRMLRMERASVEAALPPAILADTVRTHALNVALSFQCWRLLRHDQEMNVADARAVVAMLLEDSMAQTREP